MSDVCVERLGTAFFWGPVRFCWDLLGAMAVGLEGLVGKGGWGRMLLRCAKAGCEIITASRWGYGACWRSVSLEARGIGDL